MTWMAAAASLVGFYAWWGSKLAVEPAIQPADPRGTRHAFHCSTYRIALTAVVITALGMVCDFSGEGSAIHRLVEHAPVVADGGGIRGTTLASRIERDFTLLSAGAANGLYTVGGVLLTLVTPGLPRWVRWAMWLTWLAAAVMTVAAIMNHVGGMVVSTAVLFPLLLIWIVWMGARWRPA